MLDGSETLAIREAASSLGLMFEWLWPILSSTWLELLCLLTRFVCSASEHSYPRSSGVSGEFPGELSHLYLTRLQIYAASSQLLNYSCLYSGRHYGWPCIILVRTVSILVSLLAIAPIPVITGYAIALGTANVTAGYVAVFLAGAGKFKMYPL